MIGVGGLLMTDDLLRLADEEIRQLQAQLTEVRAALASLGQATESLSAENAALYRQLKDLAPPPAVAPLEGLRIGIIGHPSREVDYREVVERLGGQLLFAGARDKLGLIDRVVQKTHGSIFLTTWGSHKASQRANDAAVRYGRPLLLWDQPGLSSVERVILEQLLPILRTGD